MKLTTKDIQFIDAYLENSDVIYADIRIEMVDHVASDIENRIEAGDTRDFYHVFKDYMIENKTQLLKNNKQFVKSADKKIWKALLQALLSPKTPFLFLIYCIGFYLLYLNFSLIMFRSFIVIIPLLGVVGFIFTYAIYQNINKLKRFSVVERLALPFLAFYQVTNIIFNFSKFSENSDSIFWVIVAVSLTLTLMSLLIIICIKLFKNYDKRFKNLA